MNNLMSELSGRWMQTEFSLLLQITVLLLLGISAGRLLQRHGPVWQTLAYRATLSALGIVIISTVLLANRLPNHISLLQPSSVSDAWAANSPVVSSTIAGDRPGSAEIESQRIRPDFSPSRGAPIISIKALPVPSSPRSHTLIAKRPIVLVNTIWLLGVGVFLGWTIFCKISLIRLHHTASPVVNSVANASAEALARRFGAKAPSLYMHSGVRSPFLTGVINPTIYLPVDYSSQFGPATLRSVLAHEMAHLARRDVNWLLVGRFAEAVLWFHPLVWLLRKRMVDASEEACDALVIELGSPPAEYANSLLSLAERWPATRLERGSGICASPVRSALGRRIRSVLDRSKTYSTRVSARARTSAVLGAAAVAISLVILFCPAIGLPGDANAPGVPNPWSVTPAESAVASRPWIPADGYLNQFGYARRHGWSAAPVSTVPMNASTESVGSGIYPVTAAQEVRLLRACQDGQDITMPSLSSPGRIPSTVKARLEEMLRDHPHFYFAEYRLAVWYLKNGQVGQFHLWMDRALSDAPSVLAGRFQYADGRPIAGVTFRTNVIDCMSASFKATRANPALVVSYEALMTDRDGCYYIPVERGIHQGGDYLQRTDCGDSNRSFTALDKNMATEFGSTVGSQFINDAHVGILPPTSESPYIQFAGGSSTAGSSDQTPLHVSANRFTLTWKQYPNCTGYAVSLYEFVPVGKEAERGSGRLIQTEGSTIERSPKPSITLELNGSKPTFDRNDLYTVHVAALRGQEKFADSHDFWFIAEGGAGPIPLTKKGIEFGLPGYSVESIRANNESVNVRCLVRQSELDVNALYGPHFDLPLAYVSMVKPFPDVSGRMEVELIFSKSPIREIPGSRKLDGPYSNP